MGSNQNLLNARIVTSDEFYTRLPDIEKELIHIDFNRKSVYANCDTPQSQFCHYFANHPVKDFIATSGDFRSEESIALLDQADIIVTNPPFSLFSEFIDLLISHNKQFVIVGPVNATTYRDIFPLFQGGQIKPGYNRPHYFTQPDGTLKPVNASWFTNLDYVRRERLNLTKPYSEAEYPKYDNIDAINVNKPVDIPLDYDGVMGVPITFLSKHDPAQFDIVGHASCFGVGAYLNGKRLFKRILIRKRSHETSMS